MTSPIRVLCIASQPLDCSPSQRFRFEQWLRLLPRGSVEFELRPLFSARTLEHLYDEGRFVRKAWDTIAAASRRAADVVRAGRFDVVLLQREAFPLGPPLFESLFATRVPVVFDFDDAIFLGDTSPANRLIARWKSPDRVGEIIRRSTVTTVGNGWLAAYATQRSTRVEVLPTTIDTAEYAFRRREVAGMATVGWSGSRTTSAHLRTIEPALRRMLNELPVNLLVIGDPEFRLPGAPRVTALPWRASSELRDLDRIDIGLMPLPNDEWSKGKCGLKALQYMAVGAAAIVSPVGVNPQIIRSGHNGVLADGPDEWVEAVARLLDDPDDRLALTDAGRATVEREYSGQVWAPRFLQVLRTSA